MTRFVLSFILFAPLVAFAAKGGSEKDMLSELGNLAGPLDRAQADDLDAEEIKELFDKRGKQALALVTKFESEFPKSPSLNDARLLALKVVSMTDSMATAAEPIALAKRLRSVTAKGTDHAAQADMFLVGADIRQTLRESKSSEDFSKAWNKNAEAFRKKIADYLDDHPKYRPAADTLQGLAPLLELAGDLQTRDLILASIEKNLPDHPLARAAALRKLVGSELQLSFTPLGADKASSLKDLRGKVVVVNFWASWCQPCQAELRQLKELHDKYHKDGLEIVGFSLDEKDSAAERFVKKYKIDWPQVIGKAAREAGERFGIETVPVQLLIDRDGRLHAIDALGKLPALLPRLMQKSSP